MGVGTFIGTSLIIAFLGRSMVHYIRSMKTDKPSYYQGGFQKTMTAEEASMILNVRANATSSQIKKSHREIMMANHPDRGGSSLFALKINEAKEILLSQSKPKPIEEKEEEKEEGKKD